MGTRYKCCAPFIVTIDTLFLTLLLPSDPNTTKFLRERFNLLFFSTFCSTAYNSMHN